MVEPRGDFERDLEAIEAKVIELFAMVAEDLPEATHALLSGDNDVLHKLTERDHVIDGLYREIEELVNRQIVLQAPVASDLRFLLSVLRIVPELERSHDLVVQIASRANHVLGEDLSPRSRAIVERMGKLASDMWRQAVDSWARRLGGCGGRPGGRRRRRRPRAGRRPAGRRAAWRAPAAARAGRARRRPEGGSGRRARPPGRAAGRARPRRRGRRPGETGTSRS